MKDPIVEEVRKHRMEHSRKFGGDLAAICRDLRSIQKASSHKVVRLPPRKRMLEAPSPSQKSPDA